jgi:hypothetical protein
MCASRQAIVVTGAGTGSGDAMSMVHAPEPADIGAADVPRGRMLQQPRTGSQRYSSSVRPSSRGRRFLFQCQSSCSASRSLLVIFRTLLPADACVRGSGQGRGMAVVESKKSPQDEAVRPRLRAGARRRR